jgi:hypothetical protein
MIFKILLLSVFISSISFVSYSQTKTNEEADAMIHELGMKKLDAIAKLVPIDAKDTAAFWRIYNEYQEENKKTAKSRLKLWERTAEAYQSMNATIADSITQAYFKNRTEQEKSLEKYYQKIKDATNAVTGFAFYQAETYLLTLIRVSIMEEVPTYGEVFKKMKK